MYWLFSVRLHYLHHYPTELRCCRLAKAPNIIPSEQCQWFTSLTRDMTFWWKILAHCMKILCQTFSWHERKNTQATSRKISVIWGLCFSIVSCHCLLALGLITCQNLQFLASMFVCRFVCLSVSFVKRNSWTLWHIITKLGPHMEWLSSSSMWHWQISRSWN